MRVWLVSIVVLIGAVLLLWDWDRKEGELVRVDIPLENSMIHIMEEDVGEIKSILSNVKWDKEFAEPTHEMDRKLILFYDSSSPHRLERLRIWYQDDGSAIVYNDYEDQYGEMDQEVVEKVERIINEHTKDR